MKQKRLISVGIAVAIVGLAVLSSMLLVQRQAAPSGLSKQDWGHIGKQFARPCGGVLFRASHGKLYKILLARSGS
jgi:hypothetical protein